MVSNTINLVRRKCGEVHEVAGKVVATCHLSRPQNKKPELHLDLSAHALLVCLVRKADLPVDPFGSTDGDRVITQIFFSSKGFKINSSETFRLGEVPRTQNGQTKRLAPGRCRRDPHPPQDWQLSCSLGNMCLPCDDNSLPHSLWTRV